MGARCIAIYGQRGGGDEVELEERIIAIAFVNETSVKASQSFRRIWMLFSLIFSLTE